jgi:hypothetical protein
MVGEFGAAKIFAALHRLEKQKYYSKGHLILLQLNVKVPPFPAGFFLFPVPVIFPVHDWPVPAHKNRNTQFRSIFP